MLLITGITGLTGRFLLGCLREAGYDGPIRCLVREQSDVSWIRDNNVDLYIGDVSNVQSLKSAIIGASSVIHLVNICYSSQVMQACYSANVSRIIIVSTTGIFSKFREYSGKYRQIEKNIITSDLQYTIIRPTMIYGNERDKNIHKLVRIVNRYPMVPVAGNGQGLMQPIYARDLGDVIAAAYLKPISKGKVYNVAGKQPIKYIDILKLIATAVGKKRIFVHIPYAMAVLAGHVGQIVPNGLINIEKIRRLQEDKVFDYSKAAADLGFRPISFDEGIRLEIKALKDAHIIK